MTQSAAAADLAARPKVGIGVMLMKDGKVLLGKRRGAHGAATYGWCGGHLEFGETLEDAARREVEEESGIKVHRLQFMCVSNIIQYGKHYLDVEFLCTEFDGEPTVRENDRLESWGWYALDELPTPLFTAVELAIDSYRRGRNYNGGS